MIYFIIIYRFKMLIFCENGLILSKLLKLSNLKFE